MIQIFKGMIRMYSILPIQIIGLYTIFCIIQQEPITFWYLYFIVGYICIMMLGVSGCYHRMLSHKGFETNKFTKAILLWFAVLSGQGSPIFWVTIHRGYHHRYSDQEKDPHRPSDGFWHSYIFWMFKIQDGQHNTKYVVDLLRDNLVLFFHKYYNQIFILSHLFLSLISLNFWLYGVILPAFVAIHSFSLQTSLNHSAPFGYRNFDTKDNSLNLTWLFFLILGEAWHNNHHADPKNMNYGGKRWWEIDPTYWLLRLISKRNR